MLVVLCVVSSSAAAAVVTGPVGAGDITGGGLAAQVAVTDDDQFEENDDYENATVLQAGTYRGLTAAGGDDDFYAVSLPADHAVTVTMNFNPAGESVYLGLFDPAEPTVVTSSFSGTVTEVVVAPEAGTYFFVVRTSLDPDETTDYALSIDVESISAIPPGTYDDIVVRDGDPDYYAVDVPAGNELAVFVTTAPDTDLEVTQYDGDGGRWGLVAVNADRPTRRPVIVDDTKYLRVATENTTASYDFEVAIDPIPTVTPGRYDDHVLLRGQYDIYALEVDPGEEVTVIGEISDAGDVPFLPVPSLWLELYDRNGTFVASDSSSLSSDNVSVVTHLADEAGAGLHYLVVVEGFGVTDSITYDLDVITDRFEENDDQFEPAMLSSGTYDDLFVAPDDADWYAIDVPDGGTLTADVLFAHADADVDARLYDEAGTLVDSSTSTTDNESVAGTGLAGGTYLLRVYAFGSRSGLYDLVVTVEGSGDEQPGPGPDPTPDPAPAFDAPIPGNPGIPTDPDGDGRFDDVNGDGQADFADVIALAFVDWASLTPAQIEALDFDGNGRVDFADVVELAFV